MGMFKGVTIMFLKEISQNPFPINGMTTTPGETSSENGNVVL